MRLSRKSLLLVPITILISMVLIACAGDPEEDSDTNDASDSENKQGGDLVIAMDADVSSLDPNGSNDTTSLDVQRNIFETLVMHGENMELVPRLAKSWEAVEDDVWEFELEEGVTFHDGSAFNADVVQMNMERLLDPDVGSSQTFLFEMITDMEVVDDLTIRFTTEYPFAPLPAHFAHQVSGMVSPELIEADYAAMEEGRDPGAIINENPIGTGHFTFDETEPGSYVRLVRNEEHWGENALLDSVTFKVVKEDGTRIAEISTGEAHISNPVSPSDVTQIEQSDDLHVTEQASVRLEYVGMNMSKEPFDNKLVRQAISMAVDKSQMIDGIYDGFGIEADGPVPPDIPGYDEDVAGLAYDVEKAKELLEEAGYADGFQATIWTDDRREHVDTAVNIQSQLEAIGIELTIEEFESGAYLEKTGNGEHDMFVIGWTNATGDIDNSTYSLFHSKNAGSPGNRTFTEDDTLDHLLDQGRQTPEETERLEIYTEVQEQLVDLAPMIYSHYSVNLLGVRDEVKGLAQIPTKFLLLNEVYIED